MDAEAVPLVKFVEAQLEELSPSQKKSAMASLRKIIDREMLRMEIPAGRMVCKCGSEDFIKYGNTKAGTPRFKCRSCGKVSSFITYGNILGFTKLPKETWYRFAECFVNRTSCPQVAEILDVTVETAWYMRARLLEAI